MSYPAKPRKLIGTRAFYAMVLSIVVPIVIQSAITNFVALLDNLMVGQVGTEQMSGVAVVNQLLFVFNITVFGGISGAGIFSAQYHGSGNTEGVRNCFRCKLWIGVLVIGIIVAVFLAKGRELISLYLDKSEDPARAAVTLDYGVQYLRVMCLGLPPFALTMIYASTLRETGETKLPMYAGIVAVAVNLLFNWLLIFGRLGFPAMGVVGAAAATVLSRYVELAIVMISAHLHTHRYTFTQTLYRTLRVPRALLGMVTRKGLPLLANEFLWSISVTVLAQFLSTRGLDVVAAQNICNTVQNLFMIAFLTLGQATAIIVGHSLGAGNPDEAVDRAWQMMAFSVGISLVTAALLTATAGLIPRLYNTSEDIRKLAAGMLRICAVTFPAHAFANTSYFTLRSGGKTVLTFFFDNGFAWLFTMPLAFVLAHLTGMPILPLFALVTCSDYLKAVLGYFMVASGIWVNNIVSDGEV